MSQDAPDHVEFNAPPVVEAILGVAFPALVGWGAQHLGLYWAAQRKRFPNFEPQPPLPPLGSIGSAFLHIGATPQTRGRYIDNTNTRVIQVQHDRFNYSWRKITPNERYPLYQTIRPEFQKEWQNFQDFLRDNGIAPAMPQALEVTYINHLARGEGWTDLSELGNVFTAWCGDELVRSGGFRALANASITTVYESSDGKNVRFDIQPGIRPTDGQDLLQFTVAVSEITEYAGVEPMMTWFDSAQKLLVDSFVRYTTPEMQFKVWGRQA